MFQTSMKKTAIAAALAAATLMGWAGSAQALAVVAKWDPLYGAPFSNLAWTGEATFEVDGCFFTLGTGTFGSGGCSGGGAITLVNAHVDFTDGVGGVAKGSLLWNTSLPSVFSMNFGPGGTVTGASTGLFAWKFGPSAFEGNSAYEFALQFTGTSVALYNRICKDDDEEDSRVSSFSISSESECKVGVNQFTPTDLRFAVIRPVPEPQPLLLFAAGLTALGLASRRRHRT